MYMIVKTLRSSGRSLYDFIEQYCGAECSKFVRSDNDCRFNVFFNDYGQHEHEKLKDMYDGLQSHLEQFCGSICLIVEEPSDNVQP